ncbi:M3 family metallopeptidase [Moheibacter lacus]|uniref:M3 family metallopeptidase n=1 Tax=Moheibacter lacus TaxID=2745851 RepID=A0A838ZSV8_9FLAO|nr:M3 family metallopeptidase [Moheibacter lacus]MBA5630068.1 M3 family metallopeptidase [Moheibacter lacus]
MNNPLLNPFDTPFQSVPFNKIQTEHYLPAFQSAIALAKEEIETICSNAENPSFENTIEALEISGEKLSRISAVFFNMNSAETNDEIQKIAQEVSPMLSEFGNDIRLNPVLFQRVKTIFEQKDQLDLTTEQKILLDRKYQSFSRNGANLKEDEKTLLREIDKELATLKVQFGQNALAETNAYFKNITDRSDLKGLPDYAISEAKSEAEKRNQEGWTFTLQIPSYLPFMTYAENRDLRKELFLAYGKKAFQENEFNNENNVKRIAELRLKRANLLGYNTHADFVLEERMAKSPEIVKEFLDDLLDHSKEFGLKDVAMLQKFAAEKDGISTLERWDHTFYAEKVKQEKFAFSEDELKPYFQLDKVVNGAFQVAKKLFGIKFKTLENIDKYHEDVVIYEVLDENDQHLALFYTDFFPREGKRAGAWMTEFRGQSNLNGKEIRPHVSIVCNFSKPSKDTPSLLTFNEVTTLFHEFGHALHGMLADITYESLSGTNVLYDFVELPSQFMENFCYEPEVLAMFAQHYQTGETIPQELIEKVIQASNYMEGYQTVRQLSFGLLDMAWHGENPLVIDSVDAYENQAFEPTNVYPVVPGTNMSVSFSHIFNGGYSSGYYSYKWSEVLDADAFAYFKEKGIFNPEVAAKFKKLLQSGGSVEPMDLYVEFRGKKPSNEALMKRAGFRI